jgi:uncharacterized iron-regulated membrane protein
VRFRVFLFWCHLTVGVLAGLVILVMSATGVALAYERQVLDWVAMRHPVVRPAPDAHWLSLDTLLARVQQASGAERVVSLSVTTDSTRPVGVGLENRRTLFVDPYTARIVGSDSVPRAIFLGVERLHRSLGIGAGLRSKAGTAITGVCNAAFLFMVLSGIYLWWPRRWSMRAFKRIAILEPRLRGRARDWNWHHAAGFWCALVLAFIVVSGMFMSYRWPMALVSRLTGSAAPERNPARGGGNRAEDGERERRGRARPGRVASAGEHREARARASLTSADASREPRGAGPNMDTLWARALAEAGNWQSIQMRLPREPGGPVAFSITDGPAGRPDHRSQLTLDARTGAVVDRQRYADADRARRVRMWMRFIHTGEAGGIIGQTIAALASAGAVVLVWTGIALAWRRLWRRLRSRQERRAAQMVTLTSSSTL